MVGTRNSISTPDPEAELDADPDISPETRRRMKNIMKKLQIDALPALKGEAIQRDAAVPTYHYRGSTFVVTEQTPRIWLDQEPSRYKKRRSSGVGTGTDGENEHRPAAATTTTTAKTLHKMKATDKPSRKRARTPHEAEEEAMEQSTPKRPRRQTERYTHDYSRPKDISDFTPGKRKLRDRIASAPVDRMWNSRMNDYTRVGGHETLSCIEHARRRAAMEGLDVHPLSEEKLRKSRRPARRPTLEEAVMSNVMRVAKLNSQIDQAERELSLSKGISQQIDIQRLAAKRTSTSAAQTAFASLLASTTTLTQEPTPPSQTPLTTEDRQMQLNHDPPNDVHISDSETSPVNSSRHDSGASIVPDDIYQPAHPTIDLPTKAKGGQDLRWSLTDRLNNVDNAESAIYTARLPDESKTARRRRVKREYALVRKWAATKEAAVQDEDGDKKEEEEAERPDADPEETEEAEVEIQVRTPTTSGEENGIPDSAERRSSRVPKHKNQVCRDWMLGACHRGDRCTYVHES